MGPRGFGDRRPAWRVATTYRRQMGGEGFILDTPNRTRSGLAGKVVLGSIWRHSCRVLNEGHLTGFILQILKNYYEVV